jgi:protein arginine kinase activator
MHKGTRHVGKRPASVGGTAPQLLPRQRTSVVREETSTPPPPPLPVPAPAQSSDVSKLRADLDLAVKEERYEDAAKLKAEIERLQPKAPSK